MSKSKYLKLMKHCFLVFKRGYSRMAYCTHALCNLTSLCNVFWIFGHLRPFCSLFGFLVFYVLFLGFWTFSRSLYAIFGFLNLFRFLYIVFGFFEPFLALFSVFVCIPGYILPEKHFFCRILFSCEAYSNVWGLLIIWFKKSQLFFLVHNI